ncbi:MAG: class I SAM-dependent methyltransferase [Anaerolineae bacterium]|nr:class I SAM-dependent methyltransferase [Anaerolineae bacterium]
MIKTWQTWKSQHDLRSASSYTLNDRLPFFDIAGKHLPDDKDAFIVDIGAGDGYFAQHLGLNQYRNLFLLDGNAASVADLQASFQNALIYVAPGKLPFEDNTVAYIHCSHLIEHLSSSDLYDFLQEMDRVLIDSGIIVVSTPMLWSRFYDDLTHVRPYNPTVFQHYLMAERRNRTRDVISGNYSIVELVYRYGVEDVSEGLHSDNLILDAAIELTKRALYRIGLKRYRKNGYTLVLQKSR